MDLRPDFVVSPVIAIIVISYCYSTIFLHVEQPRQASERMTDDKRHLKIVLTITISKNASWLTIIVIKVLALAEIKIPGMLRSFWYVEGFRKIEDLYVSRHKPIYIYDGMPFKVRCTAGWQCLCYR